MCLTKKQTTYGIFKLLSVIYFQTNVHCGMRFLDIKIDALLCFLSASGIAVSVFIYKKHPIHSSIVKSLYQIVAYQMVQNYLIS